MKPVSVPTPVITHKVDGTPAKHPIAVKSLQNLTKHTGRTKGVPNKVTTKLKDAIVEAARLAGDSKAIRKGGKGGLEGYLRHLAINNPATFGMLLGRVLPMQSVVDINTPFAVIIAADDAKLG